MVREQDGAGSLPDGANRQHNHGASLCGRCLLGQLECRRCNWNPDHLLGEFSLAVLKNLNPEHYYLGWQTYLFVSFAFLRFP